MTLKNTIGTYYVPNADSYRMGKRDYSPAGAIYIQTGGSDAVPLTATVLKCFQSASTSDLGCAVNKFHLTSISFGLELVTATSEVSVWLGACRIAQLPTGTAAPVSLSWGQYGLVGPDVTTTNTVSIACTVGGATIKGWAATGYYEV